MLIVRMARPVHHMTLRRKKLHGSTSHRSPDFVSRIRAEARHLGEPLFFRQRIGLPPVTAYLEPLM